MPEIFVALGNKYIKDRKLKKISSLRKKIHEQISKFTWANLAEKIVQKLWNGGLIISDFEVLSNNGEVLLGKFL